VAEADGESARNGIMKIGISWRWGSFWIGAHWSAYNRRLCINVMPFFTIWIVLPGGQTPLKCDQKN
jgi:hypothetical protein